MLLAKRFIIVFILLQNYSINLYMTITQKGENVPSLVFTIRKKLDVLFIQSFGFRVVGI